MSIPSVILRRNLTESTMNDALMAVRAGYGHGTVCLSQKQSSGRGRMPGRQWDNADQSMLFTLVLARSSHRIPYPLTQVMALALCRHIENAYGILPLIKWPNDVLLNGCKIAGILVESHTHFFLAGMGLNLAMGEERRDFRVPAAGLSDFVEKPPVSEEELTGILDELNHLICEPACIEELNKRLAFMNQLVRVRLGDPLKNKVVQGHIAGLNEDGALLLKLNEGKFFPIYSGEIDFS